MCASPRPATPLAASSARSSWIAAGLLVLALTAAYRNSFQVPFIYDDVPAVIANPTIHRLWQPGEVLNPPAHLTTSGRPLINLSLAINYAIGGADVTGYHGLNFLVHAAATLVLFGVLRRTFGRPPLAAPIGNRAVALAALTAAVWALHPLQTESVTYIVQRAESIVGLFYLLTLYCFIRSVDAGRRSWQLAAVLCCLLGMASKEVMVSAPLVVFLYDRAFVAGSFAAAWRARRGFYVALAATWVLLVFLVAMTGGTRDGSAGFGQGMSSWTYLLTQAKGIALYLKLSFWPDPLIFDYGRMSVRTLGEAAPYGAVVLPLVAVTLIGVVRWPVIGFVGFWFFAILAPSSSIVPVVTETLAEHRMYLPLAAVAATAAVLLHRSLPRVALPVLGLAALALAFATVQRNVTYHSHLALWSDTVAKLPSNPRAHNHLANALANLGRDAEALPHFREAVRLAPHDSKWHFNLGTALSQAGQLDEAARHFEEALRLDPKNAEAHNNYGPVLLRLGRRDEAMRHYREALRLEPDNAPAHNNLGMALGMAGAIDEAIVHFRAALRLRPDYAEAHNNLGFAFIHQHRPDVARPHFEEAVRLNPKYAEAHNNLARTYAALGQFAESEAHYAEVLRLEPAYADGHYERGRVLQELGRRDDARLAFEAAVRLAPEHQGAREQLTALRDAPGSATR